MLLPSLQARLFEAGWTFTGSCGMAWIAIEGSGNTNHLFLKQSCYGPVRFLMEIHLGKPIGERIGYIIKYSLKNRK